LEASEALKTASREHLIALRGPGVSEPGDDDVASFVKGQYGLARLIEGTLGEEANEDDEAVA